MASSKKTLDIDALTFQTLYMKAPAGQISSYVIPMIPGSDTILKQLVFLTPEQALSVGNININQSTIPDILSSIQVISNIQSIVTSDISSISTLVGSTIIDTTSTIDFYVNDIRTSIYNSTYSTLAGDYTSVKYQNISTLSLNETVINLGDSVSTLSSQYISSFTQLEYTLQVRYDQSVALSSMSIYFISYFSSLATTIPIVSTSIGNSISTTVSQDSSTVTSYYDLVYTIVQSGSGTGVSSISSLFGSTFSSFETTLLSYDPSYGLSSISSYAYDTVALFSTQFSENRGISGICSLSTTINEDTASAIANLQNIAGIPGLCSMSTYLTTSILELSELITTVNTNDTVSSFSTAIYTTSNLLSSQIYTIGYTNTIIQQNRVKQSISTLSTAFGNSYITMTSLSSFSTMLPSVYSTISSVFSLAEPYATIANVSTNQGSNISTLSSILSSTYPAVNCAVAVSSFSTLIPTTFSSLSTSLSVVYEGFSNMISATIVSFTSTTDQLLSMFQPAIYTTANTIYPSVALDRKPSDTRMIVNSANTYSFTPMFQGITGISSQELKKTFSTSIPPYSSDVGFNDIHSVDTLDTDQLFKAELGATQYLLTRLSEIEAQLSTIEERVKKGS